MKKYLIRFWPLYLMTGLLFTLAAAAGSQAVTTIAENTPIERSHIFVIDAGHGGEDGGAISCTGIAESGINLQIARKLNDLLQLLGHQTMMIRTEDISVYTEGNTIAARKLSDLKERVRIINNTENAVLISIHQNFFDDSRYSGPQVFYSNDLRAKDLAQSMQDNLVRTIDPGSHRQCKLSQGVYLMEHIRYPGILIECGFLSNPTEEAKLRTVAHQHKLCCVIATTLANM